MFCVVPITANVEALIQVLVNVELELRETLVPAHSVIELAVIVGVAGSAFTITTAVSLFVHPPASVPVTI
jgi:hypothetical protein